ncbi:DUF6124 family protein [Pseudomonas gingeri]|uniref:DUF3077 domain-containing protein n=1 Tax=Pseudomonas gingeri TaxID=117681 RepID=A0A7Y8CKZ4_9PSED|nr:hypothetical protein [Pseudomonas gingeri]NWB31829.1 hypothetical protein [Pseudomonas gingeri]NWC34998.1 hypothetical protein [Pseudomonas gingeri]NWD09608.1 hypothetical protein [Pseudomonas gingeri]NWD52484.1 hypothetical protein [Pseudomonas gingeri]NWE28749.1 hypothetical protein [Pseudomonas gingeri]
MFKPTPNPPATPGSNIDPRLADRALSHYNLGPNAVSKPTSITPPADHLTGPAILEDALVNAYSLLQSAAATAYENADNQTGANRKVAMGVVHLIEMAQMWIDAVLDKQPASIGS